MWPNAAKGPLVLMCHGWPELWYSWRHQLKALGEAGFRAVAPDMRGFGRYLTRQQTSRLTRSFTTSATWSRSCAALGETRALIVGHDWGAPVAWHAALLRPDIFPAVCAMSVPHRRRGRAAPLETLKQAGKGDYYWIYFQDRGVPKTNSRAMRATRSSVCSTSASATRRVRTR